MSGLSLRHLTKRYDEVVAVDDFSLQISDGDCVALLGPSGCGKSTVLRMIAGLLEPTVGRIEVDDIDVTALPARDRDLAMVFQSYALYPHLTVGANLAFGLAAHSEDSVATERRVAEVAEQLGLSDLLDRRPRELSGGQRQRVALGRAIARRPKAFLMDEPLSNLDARLRTATRRELVGLHRSLGATIVYVTHDQVEAMTMATKIVVMNGGRIEQIGTPLEVYDRPASTFVASFIGAPPMNLIDVLVRTISGEIRAQADGIDVKLTDGDTEAREVVLGVRPASIRVWDRSGGDGCTSFAAGVVELVENLGNEEIAFVKVGDETIAVRCERGTGLTEGQTIDLAVDPGDLHLFDGDTGRRLRWETSDVEANQAVNA